MGEKKLFRFPSEEKYFYTYMSRKKMLLAFSFKNLKMQLSITFNSILN